MQDDAKQAGKQLVPVDATQLLAAKADSKSGSSDSKAQADMTAAGLLGMPMFAGETGKGLPQLAWSGYVGVADNNGASAVALQGDQNNVLSTQVVAGKDLPGAVLKAQEQMASTQLQQGATANGEGTGFASLMNKENLPALHMTHQFTGDNSSLLQVNNQNNAVMGTAHTGMANDLSAMVGANAARGGDNSLQQINVPVQNAQWGHQLGDRVQWMVGQNLHQADIHLNPPELGALKVHIQMHGDQANVSFSSPHAQVRDALDAATPRLREMMHEAGLTLGDVNVSGQALAQHQSRDPQNQQAQSGQQSGVREAEEPQAIAATGPVQRLSSNGMLDVYA